MSLEADPHRWFLDQLTKSEFFHQKLHEWQMLDIAEAIDCFLGEALEWDLPALGISEVAWKKVIHRGVKPVTVFAHPEVLILVPGATAYYRMLSMVSQKSMHRVGLSTNQYEVGSAVPNKDAAGRIALHLNKILSRLIELDERVDPREFDLWRGMAAGTQAQGSWQNAKGAKVDAVIKGLIQRRLREKGWVIREAEGGTRMDLSDGRAVFFADEPDIAVYRVDQIRAAVEIKGGIDPAG
ncbi:MAG: XcyI family restriction endonuclease, partial [Anaerolineae bacterium]